MTLAHSRAANVDGWRWIILKAENPTTEGKGQIYDNGQVYTDYNEEVIASPIKLIIQKWANEIDVRQGDYTTITYDSGQSTRIYPPAISGTGTLTYYVDEAGNTYTDLELCSLAGSVPTPTPPVTTTTTITTTTAAVIEHYVIDWDDYDGDGATDAAVYHDGAWEIQNVGSSSYGEAGSIPVSGDYDGDGTADRAYFTSGGLWYVEGVYSGLAWGAGGQIPVPADYDGDGSTDPATYSPTFGTWYIYPGTVVQYGGRAGDIPVPGDYDGDGTADRALYRWVEVEQGKWYVDGVGIFSWGGSATDIPVPMDYDGDGVTDPTVARNLSNTHFLWLTIDGDVENWGIPAVDTPLTADFNGDGAGEAVTWRAHRMKWFARNGGFTYRLTFGDSAGVAAIGQAY